MSNSSAPDDTPDDPQTRRESEASRDDDLTGLTGEVPQERSTARAARGSAWSFRLATVSGIPVRIHATFLLLLAWIGATQWLAGTGLRAGLEAVLLMVLVFATVVVHELSHALVARRFGARTRDILLLPIGGVASMENIPRRPREELLVALAGPATNVVIAAALFGAARLLGGRLDIDVLLAPAGGLLVRLAWVNVSLAVFNLLPAFPMDGGRALRALLSTSMPRERATRLAARIGQGIAMGLGLLGLFVNPFLVFIALFVWIGAAEEAKQTELDSLLEGATAKAAIMHDYRTLSPSSTIGEAAAIVLDGWQRDFPVVHDGIPQGVLTRSALIGALSKESLDLPVASIMDRHIVAVAPDDALEDVLARMRSARTALVVVVEDGQLRGIITLENVLELVEFTAARRVRGPSSPRGAAQQTSSPAPI